MALPPSSLSPGLRRDAFPLWVGYACQVCESGDCRAVAREERAGESGRQWLDQWIRLEKDAVSLGTLNRYQQIARNLVDDLGPKADAPLEALTTDDFLKFKENRLKAGLSPRLTSSSKS